MKKTLCFLSVLYVSLFSARAQNADLGIGSIIMPYAGTANIGQTIQIKADIRNFGFNDLNAGCAFVTISVPSNICSITGLNSGSSSIWTISSSSMPASVTLQNTGGPLPADFEPYYIILNVQGINPGGPLTINAYTSNNPFQGGCMACGNLDPYNDNATTSIIVSAPSPLLPLHFMGYTIQDKGCSGTVSWTTADEISTKDFQVQQSFDGVNFSTVRTLASLGNGNHNYETLINQSQQKMFYRIIEEHLDNRKFYSAVQILQLANCTQAKIVQVYPVPANRNQNITMQANSNDRITYRLMDISGKVIRTGIFVRTTQMEGVNSGIYQLEMTSAGFKETQTIIVQ